MHRRAVTCNMCQQQFFPASIKFHIKVCAEKQEHIQLPCAFCGRRFQCTALKAHMKFCGRSKGREQAADGDGSPRRFGSQETTTRRRQSGMGGACESTRASGANSEPDLQRRPRPRTASSRTAGKCSKDTPLESAALASSRDDTDDAGSPRGLGGNEDGSSRQVGADDRVACSNCLRRFSPDRVGVHQDICKRVNAAAAKRERRKTPKTSKPQSASWRRRSNRPVLGQFRAAAAARERGALWSSGDQGQRHFLNPHVKFSTKNRMRAGTASQVWGGSTDDREQGTTSGTPRSSSSRVFLSVGADESFSSHGHEASRPPQTEERRHQRGGDNLRRSERSLAAAPCVAERLEQYGRNRRPASAAGRASFSEPATSLVSAEGVRRRGVAGGRAVSMSCSPVRLRRSRTSIVMQQARGEGHGQQHRVIGRLGKGFGGMRSRRADDRGQASPNLAGSAIGDRIFGSERFFGGRGFFSPSREGGRVRLLR